MSVIFERQHADLIEVYPSFIEIYPDGPTEFMITVLGKSPGHSFITTNITSNSVIKYKTRQNENVFVVHFLLSYIQ